MEKGYHNKPATPRTVLLATVGTSPAVLTETVWALAHPTKKGAERIVPDEIVVLTTLRGKKAIEAELLGPGGGWERMVAALRRDKIPIKEKLAFGDASIRILDHGKTFLDDIRTAEENESVANLLLDEITKVTETANTRLLASIAGGRKTMGALLLSCMCLRGREEDHVLHILVNEPFESRLDPPFLFPDPKAKHAFFDPSTKKTTVHRGADARLDLIDLPFVKMRGWYQDKFKALPPRYDDLVHAAQSSGPPATAQHPMLHFDFKRGIFSADDYRVQLAATEFVVLSLDLMLAPENLLVSLPDVRKVARNNKQFGWFQDFGDGSRFSDDSKPSQTKEDLTKVRSQIRTKLKRVPVLEPFLGELVPRGAGHGSWPQARISADIPDFWTGILS